MSIINEKNINGVYRALFRKTHMFYHELGNPYKQLLQMIKDAETEEEAISMIAGYSEEMARIGFQEGINKSIERVSALIKGE